MNHFFWILALIGSTATAADSVWVYNATQQQVELERDSQQVRAIASITKIMTAMVALDHDPDLDRRLMLNRLVGSHLPSRTYSRKELFDAMLVKSDNAAAETLAADYPGGRNSFIAAMNARAQRMGLVNTSFQDPSGLGPRNLSTARETGQLIRAGAVYALIRETSVKTQVAIETTYQKKIRTIDLTHTNQPLLFEFDNIIAGKTGLTSAAGWCVALLVEQAQRQYVIVVLGSRTKQARLDTVKNLMYNHVQEQDIKYVP